jgi:RND superfamily putative drug exporter
MSTAEQVRAADGRVDAGPTSETARNLVREIRKTRQMGEAPFRWAAPGERRRPQRFYSAARAPAAIAFILTVTLHRAVRDAPLGDLALKSRDHELLSSCGLVRRALLDFRARPPALAVALRADAPRRGRPVVMFCALFGLSMDYEVLMLSRMREEYLAHGRQRLGGREGSGAYRPARSRARR